MDNSTPDGKVEIYTPPTREALVTTVYSDGIYSAKCRVCKRTIRGKNIEELNQHKCEVR